MPNLYSRNNSMSALANILLSLDIMESILQMSICGFINCEITSNNEIYSPFVDDSGTLCMHYENLLYSFIWASIKHGTGRKNIFIDSAKKKINALGYNLLDAVCKQNYKPAALRRWRTEWWIRNFSDRDQAIFGQFPPRNHEMKIIWVRVPLYPLNPPESSNHVINKI